ncbi:MAG: flagellar hook protein FlgE [Spirochaetes bacterium GWF1_51_8]|nr:MAG: flagellar hook protein FlgE [Spirochaetes bacterium GWF1_51_8]
MMRSLYSAVSGLQNHQLKMDVLGNNVSNVNTVGFKTGRVTFQDILSQTLTGAAKPTDERGGLNPKQVGLGMSVASIDTIMRQGSIQTTGKNTDIAIQGEGFFVVNSGDETFYTRAGNFMIDKDGNLVNPNGMKVQGWKAAELENGMVYTNTNAPMEDVIIPIQGKLEAKETQIVLFKSNLDMNAPVLGANPTAQELKDLTWDARINIYDRYGNASNMTINFKKTDLNAWQGSVSIDGIAPEDIKVNIGAAKIDTNNQFNIQFNTNGTILNAAEAQGANPQIDAEGELIVTVTYNMPDGTQHTFDLQLGTSGQVADSITQFAAQSSTKAYFQNGNSMGYLSAFRIDDSGTITGVYDNGVNKELGKIAIATFVNPMGLEKAGNNLFVETNNSGYANAGEAGTMDRGIMIAGALEMSNVDLSETFVDMIVTERGFQANSRVVTTSDNMLQEILNLKR